jgi:uncharacterized protein
MDSRLRGNDVLKSLLLLLLLFIVAPANAQTFPALTGRVVDAANIMPDAEEAALDAKLKALEDTTDRQLVVATIPSLEGYPIDDYGYRLGRAWGIGQEATNNGALLIVAPNDRKVRVEVGYGLEPILTDAWSSVVINTQIVPQFKANNYPAGIIAGADAIIAQLQLPPEEAEKRAQLIAKTSAKKANSISWGDAFVWFVIIIFFVIPILRSMFSSRGRRHGVGPVIIWGGNDDDWGGGSGGGWGGGGGGGGFSGGGGSFGGGGASGGW